MNITSVLKPRILVVSCLAAVCSGVALSAGSAEADAHAFLATFDDGLTPEVPLGDAVQLSAVSAETVSGKKGKALAIGRTDSVRKAVVYHLSEDRRNAEAAAQRLPVFPLHHKGTLTFDFQPRGWKIGGKDECYLFRIYGEGGSILWMRYVRHRGKPVLQAVYGLAHTPAGQSKEKPRQRLNVPIEDLGPDHWHHVRLSWNERKMTLSVDDRSVTESLAGHTIPPHNGYRLELGVPYGQHHHAKGETHIDNFKLTREGPETRRPRRLPMAVVGKASGGIQPDGALDDPAWQNATLLTGFLTKGANHYSVHQPSVYVTHDDTHLYVAVNTPLYRGNKPTATVTGRDEAVWEDDSIEIFVDPTPDTADYFQFVVNSIGTLFDNHVDPSNPTRKMRKHWNLKGVRNGHTVTEQAWTMEIAIPYLDLPGARRVRNGDTWYFNVAESRGSIGANSLCPVDSFHDYTKYGRIVFHNALPRIRVHSFGPIRSGVARLVMETAGPAAQSVQAYIKGRQYDATANAYFPIFSESVEVKNASRTVFEADADKLRRGGVLNIEVRADGNVVYEDRLPYELMSDIEIETMQVKTPGADKKVLWVRTVQPFAEGMSSGRKARVTVRDERGEVRASANKTVRDEKMDVPVHVTGLPTGPYKVRLDLIDANGSVEKTAEHDRTFVMYGDAPPWKNSQLGISNRVPAPWTPMDTEHTGGGIAVRCWNREYRFTSESLLPSSIVSANREYLGSPVHLVAGIEGTNAPLSDVQHKLVESTEKAVVIASRGTADWGAVTAETTVEFDGFIWVDLALQPDSSRTFQSLQVQWEMPGARSKLLHSGFRSLEHVGHTPDRWHKKLDQFMGPFWIGDNSGGISFAVESFENWSNEDSARQAVVRREGDRATVTINIVDKPKRVQNQLSYGFCLHPTPVRPQPDWYRKVRWMNWFGYLKRDKPYPLNLTDVRTERYQGSPNWCVTDDELRWYCEVARPSIEYGPSWTYEGMDKDKIRSGWYVGYRCNGRNSPGMIWGRAKWRTGERDKLYSNRLRGYHRDIIATCKVPDFRDYYLWRLAKSRQQHSRIDGLYFDLMGWEACAREEHGHGYTDTNGQRHAIYPIREHREWMKRIYTYLKEDDPKTPVILHLSGQAPKIMGYSFCDFIYTGELWLEEVQRDLTYAGMSLDKFRTEGLSHLWGPTKLWISQLKRALKFMSPAELKDRTQPAWAHRHLLGMVLVHDLPVRESGIDGVVPVWKTLDQFGLDRTYALRPYWSDDNGIRLLPRDKNVVATGYAKRNHFLIVVFNNTDAAVEATLRLSPSRFPADSDASLVVTDSESGDGIGEGRRFSVRVPRRNFRMLTVHSR